MASEKVERKGRSDKGRKRTKYLQKVRKQRAMFADLQRTVEAVNKFEAKEQAIVRSDRLRKQRQQRYREQAKAAGKTRSMSAEAKANQKAKRREDRAALLQLLCPSRHCSLCGECRLNSRAWVLIQTTRQFICKGCYQKAINKMGKASFLLFMQWLAKNGLTLTNDETISELYAKDASNGGVLK